MKKTLLSLALLGSPLLASCETTGELMEMQILDGTWTGEALCRGSTIRLDVTLDEQPGGEIAVSKTVYVKHSTRGWVAKNRTPSTGKGRFDPATSEINVSASNPNDPYGANYKLKLLSGGAALRGDPPFDDCAGIDMARK